jgi:PPOX class probable F420-dependent enzyme
MRIDQNEARSRFSSARVARLATVSADGLPHIVPVTFAVAADMIYTAIDAKPKTTRDLRRLRNIRHSPRVALLADRYDENWTALWWVRADGDASVLDDPAELTAPVSLLVSRYRQYTQTPPAWPVIAIRVTHWTGWSAG